jgi:hypothetical protein
MKTVLILLLALFLIANARHARRHHQEKDLRAEYERKSIQHEKLAREYFTQYKKYLSLARQYHQEARRFSLTSRSHRFSARKYGRDAERHHKAERKYYSEFLRARRSSGRHLRKERKFVKLYLHYEELARQARNRAAHHKQRHLYYKALARKDDGLYRRQRSDRISDLRKRAAERKLEREYSLKARNTRKQARSYDLDAANFLKRARGNKRASRKYALLHRRAVYEYNFRLHKRRFRVHRLKRRQLLKRARFNKKRASHYLREALKAVRRAKFHARFAERLDAKINFNKKEIAKLELKNRHLEKLVILQQRKIEANRRRAVKARNLSKRHREEERTNLKLASRQRVDALKERKAFRRWFALYRSTFNHRRVVRRRK